MDNKDLLGRIWIDLVKHECQIPSPRDKKKIKVLAHTDPTWHELIFDATGAKEGSILVAYDLIPIESKDAVTHLLIPLSSLWT